MVKSPTPATGRAWIFRSRLPKAGARAETLPPTLPCLHTTTEKLLSSRDRTVNGLPAGCCRHTAPKDCGATQQPLPTGLSLLGGEPGTRAPRGPRHPPVCLPPRLLCVSDREIMVAAARTRGKRAQTGPPRLPETRSPPPRPARAPPPRPLIGTARDQSAPGFFAAPPSCSLSSWATGARLGHA